MPHAEVASQLSLEEQAQSACLALGDDEHRRWEARCLALEGGEGYPWGTSQSRAFVGSILACLFGDDLVTLDGPTRSWARTNTTMAVFTRRLGCLRELIGEEAFLNGRE